MKSFLTVFSIICFTLSSTAQIYTSGGLFGRGGSNTSYGRTSGGGSSSSSGTKIYFGGTSIFKNNIEFESFDNTGKETLKIAVKYFIGATHKEWLFTGNFEVAISSSDVTSLNTRYYGEAAYPILGSMHGRLALVGFAGLGVNSLEAGSSYDHDDELFIEHNQETKLYIPLGAYVNLNVLNWYGIRLGYQFAYNGSDYAEKAFSSEGFMLGSYYRF